MPDPNQELLIAIRSLTLVMTSLQRTSEGGMAGGGGGQSAGAIKPLRFTSTGGTVTQTRLQQVALNNFTNSMRDGSIVFNNFNTTMKVLSEDVGLASGAFGTLISSADTFWTLNRVASRTVKSFQKSNSAILRLTASQIRSADDLDAAQTQLEGLKDLQDILSDTNLTIEEVAEQIEAAGFGDVLHDLTLETGSAREALEMFKKDIITAGVDLGKFAAKSAAIPGGPGGGPLDMLKGLKGGPWGIALGFLANQVMGAAGEFQDMILAASKFGSTVNLTTAFMAGMKPEEMAELYSTQRRSILSLGGTFDAYNKQIEKGQEIFGESVLVVKDRTKLTASLTDQFYRLGTASGDSTGFLERQSTTYEYFNRVLGYTSEQFAELNEYLLSNTGVTKSLLVANKKNREGILQTYQAYFAHQKSMGVLTETAKEAIQSIESLQDLDASGVFEQALRLRGGMLLLGRGIEDANAAMELSKKASIGDAQAKVDLIEKTKEAAAAYYKKLEETGQSGVNAVILTKDALIKQLGPENKGLIDAVSKTLIESIGLTDEEKNKAREVGISEKEALENKIKDIEKEQQKETVGGQIQSTLETLGIADNLHNITGTAQRMMAISDKSLTVQAAILTAVGPKSLLQSLGMGGLEESIGNVIGPAFDFLKAVNDPATAINNWKQAQKEADTPQARLTEQMLDIDKKIREATEVAAKAKEQGDQKRSDMLMEAVALLRADQKANLAQLGGHLKDSNKIAKEQLDATKQAEEEEKKRADQLRKDARTTMSYSNQPRGCTAAGG